MQYLISIFTFGLILLTLVLIHEAGHFFVAKFFKIKVEEFGFGLPPRLWGKKIGETIYSINWLPIGGFVRLLGEDEDKLDTISDKKRSFAHARPFVKGSVAAAGVVMNFILTVVIFTGIYSIGGPIDTGHVVVGDIISGSVVEKSGFKLGDVITHVNGQEVKSLQDFQTRVQPSSNQFTAQREGSLVEIGIAAIDPKRIYIAEVVPGSPADSAGMKTGDVIVAVNGTVVNGDVEFRALVKQHLDSPMKMTLLRGDQKIDVSVTARANPPQGQGALGVALSGEFALAQDIQRVQYPIWEAPIVGMKQAVSLTGQMYVALGSLVSDIATKQRLPEDVGGPIQIAYVTHQAVKTGLESVVFLVGLLSLNLAIINILPIPALDGGRLFFVLLETVTRRKVSPTFEKWAHTVGFAVLLGLIALVFYRDIVKIVIPFVQRLIS